MLLSNVEICEYVNLVINNAEIKVLKTRRPSEQFPNKHGQER